MIDFGSRRVRLVAAVVLALAVLPTLWFGARSYGSLLLLRTAYELGQPNVSNVRAWMTLGHVAATYRVPADTLVAHLELPPAISLDTSLRALADRESMTRFDYVQRVQRAIVDLTPRSVAASEKSVSSSWLGINTDAILSALLVYGYPALGLTLFLGAIGLPVPTGLATTLAGSLAASGELSWLVAAAVAVVASVAGDIVGYAIGRRLGTGFIERRGKWLGLTPSRYAHVQRLFERWGGVTVLLTRTLVSHLSSVMSLLAGVSGYRFAGFIAFALAGRILWTSAYMGLGFGVAGDVEAASTFLANLSGLIIGLAVVAAASVVLAGYAGRTKQA